MWRALWTFLCFYNGHLVTMKVGAARPNDDAGSIEVIAVGRSASLQREHGHTRRHKSQPVGIDRSALVELVVNTSGHLNGTAREHFSNVVIAKGSAPAAPEVEKQLPPADGSGPSVPEPKPASPPTQPPSTAALPNSGGASDEDLQKGGQAKSSASEEGEQVPPKGKVAAAPSHSDESQQQAALSPTLVSLPDEAKPEKGPIQELFNDPADGSTAEGHEATQELNDIVVDVEEVERLLWKVGSKVKTFFNEMGYRHVGVNLFIYAATVFIVMGLYVMWFQHREVPKEQEFKFGLCECLGDVRVCFCGLLCPAIRWADTVSEDKGGFLYFSSAFLLMMGLGMLVLCPLTGAFAWLAITVVGVCYRQKIREKHGLESHSLPSYLEDAFAWCCCAYCALCQEARQVEDFENEEPEMYRGRSLQSW